MMTVFVATVTVLILALFALMAIVPLLLTSSPGADMPDNVVHLEPRRADRDARDAA